MILDLLFVDLIHSYLDTAASRAVGVPAAADCALLKMDADTDDIDPRICITAVEQGDGHSRQISVIASARGTAARSVTDPWLKGVATRLADQSALWAHIASQPLAKRTGYQIEHITPPASARIQREEDGPIETGVGIQIHVTV